MNISEFNKVLYKGNVNIDFYLYCLKKNPKIIIYPFINLILFLLTFISIKLTNLYELNKYKYLKHIKDLKKVVKDFYNKKDRINDNIKDIDIIIDTIPSILIPNNLSKKIISYELTKDYKIDKTKYNKELSKIKESDNLYVRHTNNLDNINSKKIIKVKHNKLSFYNKRYPILNKLKSLLSILIVSLILTCISFLFTSIYIDPTLIKSYFVPKLFILNFLPTFLFISLLTIISKRVHIAYLIDSALLLVLGIANQTKLLYRDDIVKVSDMLLYKEAAIMTEKYELYIRDTTIFSIVAIIIMFFILKKYIPKLQMKWKKHIISIVLTLIVCLSVNKFILHCDDVYKSVADGAEVNIYVATRQSQNRGLVYPFTYSYTEMITAKPDGYSKEEAEKELSKYKYTDLKEEQKVNIIAIMLEAHQDMSKWKNIEIDDSAYEDFNYIQENSISGEIVTSIFGGSTIVTERNFVTGYYEFPDFRTPTNSYAWYFKDQGYRVEAMHPNGGRFYNRNTITASLGFEEFYNYDNYFKNVSDEEMVGDDYLIEKIIRQYEKSKKNNTPYFNFSVTYQNHGPYNGEDEFEREYFFEQGNYDKEIYNTVNSYLTGVKKTNKYLRELVEYFDDEELPTIIILFGDHNPYISEGTKGFEEFGINMEKSTDEGFDNYYKTPYIIHANDSAKKIFGKEFVGEGEDMSPMFLMSYLLDYCGIKGDEYNQYLNEYRQTTNVVHPMLYQNDNSYIRITNEEPSIINEYKKINYYYANNFKYKR